MADTDNSPSNGSDNSDSGQSQPDQTNADNPSPTGVPSANTQGSDESQGENQSESSQSAPQAATTAGLSGNAPAAVDTSSQQSNVNTEGNTNLNPAQPADTREVPTGETPGLKDLATQSVEEEMGPDAHNNPTFKDRVADKEKQMRASIEATQNM